MKLNRSQMAWRAAQDIADGALINLGIGLPVAVADYVPEGLDVFFQSENGVVGVGPLAAPDKIDTDLVDAGSRPITLRPGATIVDSAWSFAMIRGGHIDVTILGAFEVAENGDLANWDMKVPHKGPLVGGAMDLAAGKEVRVFNGREYVLEKALTADLAIIRADTADRLGNLTFRYAQANFGPAMATAAAMTVAEVRAITAEPIPHDRVQLPGIYVDRVVIAPEGQA